jgi:L-lactate dehydrogenase
VQAFKQEHASVALEGAQLLVLTHGVGVTKDRNRQQCYAENRDIFRVTALDLCRSFAGVVLVVTNPVDALARFLHVEAGIPWHRIIGLGTLVETARARASLSEYLMPQRPARDVPAFGLGTHDDNFVLYVPSEVALEPEREQVLELVRKEVVAGAKRVKELAPKGDDEKPATVFPIAESVVAVARALAHDSRALLTVSTLDHADPDRLFYSVPCFVGASGIRDQYLDMIDVATKQRLVECRELQRQWLGNVEDFSAS